MLLGATAALAGVLAIFGVYWICNAPPVPDFRPTRRFRCDSMSPDGLYGCTQEMAHNGWCHNGQVQWRYESWAIGHDDQTAMTPEPTTTTMPTEGRQRRIPRPVFWLGIILVAGIANYEIDTSRQTAPPPQYDCDWQVTKCVNWERH